MLEILALYFLCKKMGENLRAKGWEKPIWMQIGVVLAWFGSMFLGSVAYGIYIGIKEGPTAVENIGFAVYPIALFSAAAGVALLFLIASRLPSKLSPPLLNEERG